MSTSWRISSFNGVLLAAYFIPAWTIVAFNIMVSPIHSLFDRPSIAVGLFVTDHLHLAGTGAVRAAWLLALGRLVVVAFFAIFVMLAFTPKIRKFGGCDEALSIALGIGCLISFVSMLLASLAGEGGALRLHASELLVMLGTIVVLTLEQRPAMPEAEALPASAADLKSLTHSL
jgi:hypothetical protein